MLFPLYTYSKDDKYYELYIQAVMAQRCVTVNTTVVGAVYTLGSELFISSS